MNLFKCNISCLNTVWLSFFFIPGSFVAASEVWGLFFGYVPLLIHSRRVSLAELFKADHTESEI